MKSASVYRRADAWYLCAASQTTSGVWIECEPRLKLSLDESSRSLGLSVLTALEASRLSIPHPTKWDKNLFKPMLDLAGEKSWKDFMTATESIGVVVDDGVITVGPYRNDSPKGGYTPLTRKNLSIPADSPPEVIGDAVKQAVSLCE